MARRFRKVYFIADDNKLYPNGGDYTAAFKDERSASIMADHKRRENLAQSERRFMKREPIRTYTVEGFFLVHDSLFDEILKPYLEQGGKH